MAEKKEERENTGKSQETPVKQTVYNQVKTEAVPVSPLDKFKGTYIIRPSKKTWLDQIDPKHDGVYLFDKAVAIIAPERHFSTGVVQTGLTEDEARALEAEMGFPPMKLSPHSDFWEDFKYYCRVPKDGIKLVLERSGLEKLQYAYLKANSRVALSSVEASESGMKEFTMTSIETEAKIDSSKIQVKLAAMKALASMTLEEQIEFLSIYEEGRHKVTKASSADLVLSTIGNIVEEKPAKFLDLIQDENYRTMLFLQECLQIGAIRKQGYTYIVYGTGELLGKTYHETINNLQKPEYNEMVISLKTKVQLSK